MPLTMQSTLLLYSGLLGAKLAQTMPGAIRILDQFGFLPGYGLLVAVPVIHYGLWLYTRIGCNNGMAGILRRIERQLGRGTRSGVETTRPIPEAVGDRNSVEENMGTDGQTAGNKEPIMEVLQAENCAVSLEPSEVDPKLGFEMQGPRLTYSDILVNETKPRIDPSPKPGEEKRVSLHLSGQYDSYQDNNSQILTSSGATSTDRSAVRLPVETESPEKVESSDNTRKAMAEKLVAYLATQGGCSQDKCADVQQLEDGETCAHITPTVYAIEDCQDEQGKKIHHITENLRNVQNDLVEESQSDTAFEITFEEPKHTPVTTAVVRITTQAPSETPAVSSSPPLITQSDPKQIKAKSMLTPFFDHWKETMARPEKGRIGHPAMPHVDKAPRNESRPTKVKSRLTPAFFAQRSASLGVSSRTPIRLPAISQSPNRRLGDVHKEKSELKEETRESNPRPMKAKSRFTPEFFVERKAALAVTQPGGICIPTILEISKHPGEEVEQLETNGVSESSPRTETTLYSSETTISDPSKVAAADDYKSHTQVSSNGIIIRLQSRCNATPIEVTLKLKKCEDILKLINEIFALRDRNPTIFSGLTLDETGTLKEINISCQFIDAEIAQFEHPTKGRSVKIRKQSSIALTTKTCTYSIPKHPGELRTTHRAPDQDSPCVKVLQQRQTRKTLSLSTPLPLSKVPVLSHPTLRMPTYTSRVHRLREQLVPIARKLCPTYKECGLPRRIDLLLDAHARKVKEYSHRREFPGEPRTPINKIIRVSDGPRKIYGKYNEAAPGGEVIKRSELEDVFIDKTEDSKGWNGDGVGRGLFNEERGYRSDYGTLENSVNDDDTLVCQSLAEDILGCPGEMESEPEEMEEMEFGRRFRGVATNSEMGQDSTANINPDDQVDNSVEAVDLANATHEEIMDFIQQLQHQVRHKDMQIKKLEEANHYMNAEKDLFKAEMERIRGMNTRAERVNQKMTQKIRSLREEKPGTEAQANQIKRLQRALEAATNMHDELRASLLDGEGNPSVNPDVKDARIRDLHNELTAAQAANFFLNDEICRIHAGKVKPDIESLAQRDRREFSRYSAAGHLWNPYLGERLTRLGRRVSNVQFEEEGTERGGEAVNGDIDYRTYSEAEEECYGGYKEVVQEKDNGDGGLDDCF